MTSPVIVTLRCGHCGTDTPHELHYAGRLLASTECEVCGFTIRHSGSDMKSSYVADLGQRLVSKPRRMLRRFARHPVQFASNLPASVLAKPRGLIGEWQTVFRKDR